MSVVKCARIADFCSTSSGGTPLRANESRYFGGHIPWVKSGELLGDVILDTEEHITEEALQESSAKIVPGGALLVAMYGATIGRVATLGVPAATNQAICAIIPDPTVADTRYLFHALVSKLDHFVKRGVGGAQPNISQQIIKETEVFLPPLAEQQRIAAILDQADALRTKRRQALMKLDVFSHSLFLQMFGELVSGPGEMHLSDAMKAGDGICYGVVQPGGNFPSGIPLVRGGDFPMGILKYDSLKTIDPKIEAAYRRSRLLGFELIFSCVGTIGAVAMTDLRAKGFNIARAVARIPYDTSRVRGLYLLEFLRSTRAQQYFKAETRTVAQPTLNIKQLNETPISLPPLEQQDAFVKAALATRTELEKSLTSLADLDRLFGSLQHRAFRGEL